MASNYSLSPYDNVGSGVTRSGASKFPSPWFDIASEYIPSEINQIFEWCEYLNLSMGTYRAASRRVARYFLTEIDVTGESEEERDNIKELLNRKLHIMTELAQIGDDFMCFHGDTPVVTKNGIYRIRELEGKTVEVLSKGGKYRKAEFKSFGTQSLMEVEFSDGRRILATPEHQWPVRKSTGGTVLVPTTRLSGRSVVRTVAPRPAQNEEFREGVRHGFVFGDGSIYNKHRRNQFAVANFFDEKDNAVRPYFIGHGHEPRPYLGGRLVKIHGLPMHYKQLPANDASAEYWYGFVCGFIAADGSVDRCGCTSMCQVSRAALDAIVVQLPRIGMVAGPVRDYPHHSIFNREDGTVDEYDGIYSTVTILKQFMQVDDLIIQEHRAKFEASGPATEYGKFMRVSAVKETGIVDKVYCCVEPETHTFVIDNGVLTGNCYGNVFVSIYFPFERFLICPQCKTEYTISNIRYKYKADKLQFMASCLKCSHQGEMRCDDRRSPAKENIKLIRWNPKQVRLRVHPVSGDIEHYWEIPPRFVERIIAGDEFFIRSTPMSILKCLTAEAQRGAEGSALFKFKKDSVYHFRESTLAGLPIVGWGIPPIMPNFKLAYYIQVLRRYDEAIAMDFIIPFRILHPTVGAGAQSDAVLSSNLAEFRGHMMRMVADRRKDPTNVQVAPFPVGYQMVGGEARMIAPKESIKFAVEELLNALGYPAELYMGSLNLQSAPVALRLFEKSQSSLVDGYNDLVSWIVTRIARQYMLGDMDASLTSVTMADDLERKALQLQAAAGQDVAKSTAYKPFGLDYLDEQKKIIDEQKALMKLQQAAQAEQQAQQSQQPQGQGGGASDGSSAQGGQGAQPGATPGDLTQQADQLANDMLFNMPEGLRRSQLIKIKQSNPTLHALVIQKMDEKRNAQKTQGGVQVMQSNQQAVAQGQPPSV